MVNINWVIGILAQKKRANGTIFALLYMKSKHLRVLS